MGDNEKIWVTPPLPGGVRVRHIGLLDMGEFYRQLQRWFDFKGFYKKDMEEYYMETELPDGTKKIEMRWINKKERSEYIKYVFVINFVFVGIQKVEAQQPDGTKVKLEKGDFDLRLEAYIEKQVSEGGFIKMVYEKYIIDRRMEEYKADIYDRFYGLIDFINEFFGMYVQ